MSPILVGQLPKKVMKLSKELSKIGILAVIQFFNQKPQKYYIGEIMDLPKKWRNIVDNNGDTLI